MLVPNKIMPLGETCLYRAAKLLPKLEAEICITELYISEKKSFTDLADFIDVLDLLFVLDKIIIDQDNRIIKIA